MLAGVYAIFGPRGVYVGESADVLKRVTYIIRCGFDWTLLALMPDASTSERRARERAYIEAYRRAGVPVVSQWHGEGAAAAMMRLTPEQRTARGKMGFAARNVTSEQQAAYGRMSGRRRERKRLPPYRRRQLAAIASNARWWTEARAHQWYLAGRYDRDDQLEPETVRVEVSAIP